MKKWAVLLTIGISCLVATPIEAQDKQAPAISHADGNWRFSEVSGNRVAWSCRGIGVPTTILIAGLGLTARASFGRIYQNYDGPGRLCMYDRAGIGDSKLTNQKTRTLDQLVDELHELSRMNHWDNAVLLPHSFGGFIARAYAQTYPAEVRGILFLDVAQEDYLPRLKAGMSNDDWTIMERLLKWNEQTFHEDYVQGQEAVRDSKLDPDLPITVLSRGVPYTTIRIARISDQGMDLYENEHRSLQEKIVALSKNSRYRVARYSSHVFNDSDPWVVIEELKLLIKRLSK